MLKKLQNILLTPFRAIFTKDDVTLHPGRVMVFGFMAVICLGAYLLSQPWATVQGEIRWIDALFTATSATCVTGLVVVDTGSTFTFWGQLVLLFLMEIGGLGIMTFSTFFVLALGGRVSFGDRSFFKENVSFVGLTDILGVLRVVLTTVLLVEFAGFCFLFFFKFWPAMPLDQAAFHSIFLCVSAFCNAGFALYPDNLMQYRGDVLVNLVVMSLIVIGGIGFLVYEELFIKLRGFLFRKKTPPLSLQSRIVLVTSGSLIVLGAILFFLLEWGNVLAGFSVKETALASFFQSVTARTAGFNTVDMGLVTNGTALVLMVFMMIGGSPGSCAGGVKTTTFSVLTLLILSKMRGRTAVSAFHRKLPADIIAKSIALFFAACLFVFIMAIILEISETGGILLPDARQKFVSLLFEAVSAFGTVGLSLGVTPALSFLGKWVIIITMFVGRIGPLALALTVIPEEKEEVYEYAEESVMTG